MNRIETSRLHETYDIVKSNTDSATDAHKFEIDTSDYKTKSCKLNVDIVLEDTEVKNHFDPYGARLQFAPDGTPGAYIDKKTNKYATEHFRFIYGKRPLGIPRGTFDISQQRFFSTRSWGPRTLGNTSFFTLLHGQSIHLGDDVRAVSGSTRIPMKTRIKSANGILQALYDCALYYHEVNKEYYSWFDPVKGFPTNKFWLDVINEDRVWLARMFTMESVARAVGGNVWSELVVAKTAGSPQMTADETMKMAACGIIAESFGTKGCGDGQLPLLYFGLMYVLNNVDDQTDATRPIHDIYNAANGYLATLVSIWGNEIHTLVSAITESQMGIPPAKAQETIAANIHANIDMALCMRLGVPFRDIGHYKTTTLFREAANFIIDIVLDPATRTPVRLADAYPIIGGNFGQQLERLYDPIDGGHARQSMREVTSKDTMTLVERKDANRLLKSFLKLLSIEYFTGAKRAKYLADELVAIYGENLFRLNSVRLSGSNVIYNVTYNFGMPTSFVEDEIFEEPPLNLGLIKVDVKFDPTVALLDMSKVIRVYSKLEIDWVKDTSPETEFIAPGVSVYSYPISTHLMTIPKITIVLDNHHDTFLRAMRFALKNNRLLHFLSNFTARLEQNNVEETLVARDIFGPVSHKQANKQSQLVRLRENFSQLTGISARNISGLDLRFESNDVSRHAKHQLPETTDLTIAVFSDYCVQTGPPSHSAGKTFKIKDLYN